MIPSISAETGTRSPASRNMRDPPMPWAFCDTVNSVSGVTRPSRSASNSM